MRKRRTGRKPRFPMQAYDENLGLLFRFCPHQMRKPLKIAIIAIECRDPLLLHARDGHSVFIIDRVTDIQAQCPQIDASLCKPESGQTEQFTKRGLNSRARQPIDF